jgi:hypothetical protein
MLRHTFRLVGIMLLSLTSFAHAALADSYTYQTIDVPYPTFSTRITGLTDLGKLAGLYTDLAGVDRSWRFVPPNKYEKLTYKSKLIRVDDLAGSGRIVGTYVDATGLHVFTLHSGHLRELRAPGMAVGQCAINNDAIAIACAAWPTSWDEYDGTSYVALFSGTGVFLRVVPLPWLWVTNTVTGINNRHDVVGYAEDLGRPGCENWPPRFSGWLIEGPLGANPEMVHLIGAGCADTMVRDINDAGLMAVNLPDAPEAGDTSSYAFDGTTWTELAVPGAVPGVICTTPRTGALHRSRSDLPQR